MPLATGRFPAWVEPGEVKKQSSVPPDGVISATLCADPGLDGGRSALVCPADAGLPEGWSEDTGSCSAKGPTVEAFEGSRCSGVKLAAGPGRL